jgi:Zn-dependent protease
MSPKIVGIVYQMIAFLFAISVHESAHAWTASRCGDPTARMLGRISLNPIRHIDPIGSIVLPLIAAYRFGGLIGWAKPTPVDPRNFRRPVMDDILTSVAGPVSNFVVATGALLILGGISLSSTSGHTIIMGLPGGSYGGAPDSMWVPVAMLMYTLMVVNVWLAVFNLIPVPPLDGSHVLRHFLSESVRMVYDRIGIFGLMALVFLAPGLLSRLIDPPVNFYLWMMVKF